MTGTKVKQSQLDLSLDVGGWAALDEATYEASDDPTYTLSFASDMTTILSVGMRLKVTDSTVQYFIITGVGAYTDSKTIITLYGGTDYNLSGGALTLPYYSMMKAPFGFPLDPTKWTVEVTDTGNRSQATPTQNVWYNLGSITISIPIGAWNVYYGVMCNMSDSSSAGWLQEATLSTGNDSESDEEFTCENGGQAFTTDYRSSTRQKNIILASKTSYYLNARTLNTNLDSIYFRGDLVKTIIRAVCAYL